MSEEKPKFIEKDPINYKSESEQINSGRENLWSNIEEERRKANEIFAKLIDYVNKRYENVDSSSIQSEQQLATFRKHNKEILHRVIEQGVKKRLSGIKLRRLEMAAILQDLCKGDKAPEWAENIDNFMLVYHGEAAALEIMKNEELQKLLQDILGEEGFGDSLEIIQAAIRSHMGPHPGFMSAMLYSVNKQLEDNELKRLIHPYPAEGNEVSEILLAANMYSLAGHKGVERVMAIRSNNAFLKEHDDNLSAQYREAKIELYPAEAALLSAFDNAYSARDMIKNVDDKRWVQEAIDKAVEIKYRYETSDENGERSAKIVSIEEAQQKRKEYEDFKK